jgi:hypothetical protein
MTEDKDDVGRKEDGAGSVRHKYNVGDGTLEGASSSTGAGEPTHPQGHVENYTKNGGRFQVF